MPALIALALALSSSALAADEPCYGHEFDNRIDSANYWLEWESGTITEAEAGNLINAAESARLYFEQQGYPMSPHAQVIGIYDGASLLGNAVTEYCVAFDDFVPRIQLNHTQIAFDDDGGLSTIAHEVAHTAQYSYTRTYQNGVDSWTWWLEGTATWMALGPQADTGGWKWGVSGYIADPGETLFGGILTYQTEPEKLYGTAMIASHLEAYTDDPDIIRQTWEYAGTQNGERILWPDAIEAVDVEFTPYWQDFLAHAPTVDVEYGELLQSGPPVASSAFELPAEGTAEEAERLGWQVVKFSRCLSSWTDGLTVEFEGDANATWTAVLVLTEGENPGSPVVDMVPLEVGADGLGSATLDLQDNHFAWLVASPYDVEPGSWAFSYSAASADGEPVTCSGNNDDEIPFGQPPVESSGGCSCDAGSSGAGGLGLVLAMGLLARRRRQ